MCVGFLLLLVCGASRALCFVAPCVLFVVHYGLFVAMFDGRLLVVCCLLLVDCHALRVAGCLLRFVVVFAC